MPDYSLEHIHLSSPDPQKTAAFYEKMLGAKITGSGAMPDGRSNVVVDINGLVLRITETLKGKADGLDHIGFLTDDIERGMADMKAAGHVRRRHHDGVGRLGRIRMGRERPRLLPPFVLFRLDL